MQGQWIGCQNCEAPLIAGEFSLEKITNTRINICGLGFFELYLNGKKVSDDLLVPVWSDYDLRKGQRLKYPIHDERSCQTYYCSYDITGYLQAGKNTIEVLLGNGWYNQYERMAEGEMWYGRPKLWFEMFADGASEAFLASGEWMKWKPSRIVYNNVYMGEVQDFCEKEYEMQPVEPVSAPEGALRLQQCPADRVIRTITPVLIGTVDGRSIYDAGENITGWCRFVEKEESQKTVTVRYAEELDEDGKLDFSSTGGVKQIQKDIYISAGNGQECFPHFTWHGFRYFEIEGKVQELAVDVVHTNVEATGSFVCSDETINWLVEAYLRSRLGNMHCGVPMDCPHRERLGYTGDGQAVCASDFWMLDADLFYRKWMDDIAAGQCKISGHVQHTAPFYGGGGGPGGWGCAMVLVPWEHYRRYGDKEILKKYYHNMCEYIRYMYSRCDERGLVVREEERGWCLGDWCAPDPVVLPEPFVNTYYLIRCMAVLRSAAQILGCESPYSIQDEDTLKQAMIDQYYDVQTGHFAGGVQGADVFALDIGLAERIASGNDAKLAERIAAYYSENNSFDTGFLATGILIRQLFAHGYGDVAVSLLKSNVPDRSYGGMKQKGATTLWERWNGHESHNHPMFGGPVQMLFEGLLGIERSETLRIKPLLSRHLDWAEGSAVCSQGKVSVKWNREKERITVKLSVPCRAELILAEKCLNVEAGEHSFCIPIE